MFGFEIYPEEILKITHMVQDGSSTPFVTGPTCAFEMKGQTISFSVGNQG